MNNNPPADTLQALSGLSDTPVYARLLWLVFEAIRRWDLSKLETDMLLAVLSDTVCRPGGPCRAAPVPRRALATGRGLNPHRVREAFRRLVAADILREQPGEVIGLADTFFLGCGRPVEIPPREYQTVPPECGKQEPDSHPQYRSVPGTGPVPNGTPSGVAGGQGDSEPPPPYRPKSFSTKKEGCNSSSGTIPDVSRIEGPEDENAKTPPIKKRQRQNPTPNPISVTGEDGETLRPHLALWHWTPGLIDCVVGLHTRHFMRAGHDRFNKPPDNLISHWMVAFEDVMGRLADGKLNVSGQQYDPRRGSGTLEDMTLALYAQFFERLGGSPSSWGWYLTVVNDRLLGVDSAATKARLAGGYYRQIGKLEARREHRQSQYRRSLGEMVS